MNTVTPSVEDIIGGADVGTGAAFGVVFLLIMLFIAVICLLIAVISYVIWSLGTYRLAKQLNVENAFLAWIPYAQYFTLGKVAEKCDERRGNPVKPWGKYFLIGAVGSVAVGMVLGMLGGFVNFLLPGVGVLFTLPASLISYVPLVIMYICCWKIYREFFPETVNIVMFIVSIFLNVQPIITLIASFRQPNPVENESVEKVEYTYDFQG